MKALMAKSTRIPAHAHAHGVGADALGGFLERRKIAPLGVWLGHASRMHADAEGGDQIRVTHGRGDIDEPDLQRLVDVAEAVGAVLWAAWSRSSD